ncbi:hypothetical protein [Ruegeria arenilitoris]|uniref:hypothetical protein n=1 Tax=Ruegeria arenilitoris TaxID=1173585 RepID=UPI00147A3D3C|nr:hypothetical protein [Ruegeria arenilitoris]
MESEGRVLDEAKLDTAIADLLREEESEDPEPAAEPAKPKAAFPVLPEQAEMDEEAQTRNSGLAATLRQKWAELSGAA